jgi:hypothetical protein
MTRSVPLGLILVLIFLLTGCGAVFVGFVSNPGGVPSSVSGTVTIVHLGFVDDGQGTIANVTMVTLVDLGLARTISFCGDQRAFFPIDQSMRAELTSGTLCSTLVSVAFFPSQAFIGRHEVFTLLA